MALGTTWTRIGEPAQIYADMNLVAYAKLNSQNKTANTSSVSVKLCIESDTTTVHCYTHSVSFSGNVFSKSESSSSYYHGWGPGSTTILEDTKTISHNAKGEQSFTLGGSFSCSAGVSATISAAGCALPKIQRYFTQTPTLEIFDVFETSMTFTWGTSETCIKTDLVYKIEGGDEQSVEIYNNSTGDTTGTYTLSSLNPGSLYYAYVTCKRKDSGLSSNSDNKKQSTYNWPYVESIENSNFAIAAPGGSSSQKVVLSNPLNRTGVTVYAIKKNSDPVIEFAHNSNSGSTPGQVTLSLPANTIYNNIGVADTECNIVYYCIYNDGTSSYNTGITIEGRCHTDENNCHPIVTGTIGYENISPNKNLVGTDVIIQNHSAFTVTAPTVQARGHSEIDYFSYKVGSLAEIFEADPQTYSSKTYTSTSDRGEVIISVYAVDKRGYKSEVATKPMIVEDYNLPSIAFVNVGRTGAFDSGTGIISITATRTKLTTSNSDTDVNYWIGSGISTKLISVSISPTAQLESTTIGDTKYETDGEISVSGLATDEIYTLTFNISDAISTTTATYTIDKATPLLDINAVDSAIGICEVVSDVNTDYESGLYAKNLYTTYNRNGINKTVVNSNEITLGDATYNSAIAVNGNIESNGSITIAKDLRTNKDGYVDGKLYVGGPLSNTKYGDIYLYNGSTYVRTFWYEGAD